MPIDPSAKVQIRSTGELLPPGVCALCGKGHDERGFIDMQLYIDLYGQVYFCVSDCAEEITHAIEGLTGIESVIYIQQLEQARGIIKTLTANNESLRHDINTICDVFSLPVDITDSSVRLRLPETGEDSETHDKSSTANAINRERANPKPVEPVALHKYKRSATVTSSDSPTGL